jgi:hypothetical protein
MNSIICPICNASIEIARNQNHEIVLNKHIDRCSRRKSSNRKSYRDDFVVNSDVDSDNVINNVDEEFSDNDKNDNFEVSSNEKEIINVKSENEKTNYSGNKTTRIKINLPKQKKRRKEEINNYVNKKSNRIVGSINEESENSENGDKIEESVRINDDWEETDYENRLKNIELNEQNEEKVVETHFNTFVNEKTWSVLHEYQKEGCNWLFELYQEG